MGAAANKVDPTITTNGVISSPSVLAEQDEEFQRWLRSDAWELISI